MVLNIDFNPRIEERIKINEFKLGGENIIDKSTIYPSGTGIKLEWLLNIFNERSFLTGFLGLDNEKYIAGLSKKSSCNFIAIKDIISKKIIIEEELRETIVSSQDPRITEEEVTDFYNIYHTLLNDFEYVIGFDRVPEGLSNNIHEKLAQIARIKEKKYILEIKTKENLIALKEAPYIVIVSKEILEDISNLILNTKESIAAANNYILKSGVKAVFVNLYEGGIIYSSRKESYHIIDSKNNDEFLSRCNCGLIAGMLIGLLRKYDRDMLFKLCHAYNISYNNNEIMDIRMTNVKKDMTDVIVEKIFL